MHLKQLPFGSASTQYFILRFWKNRGYSLKIYKSSNIKLLLTI